MNTEDKYPDLSNSDLAELLGLNRLIQFDKLPQRFKDMNTYVPYGHDLIELIQERLRSSGPVILFDDQEEGEEISSREPSKANHCTIDLTYYFSRNADLRATIHATLKRYGVLLDRPLAQAVDEILQKIHDEGLIAKTVSGGPAYHLFVSWDIHNHGPFADVVGRSLLDDWIITQVVPKKDDPWRRMPDRHMNPGVGNSITAGQFRPFHFYEITDEMAASHTKLEKGMMFVVLNNLLGFEEGTNLQDCIKTYTDGSDGQPWEYINWGDLKDFVHRIHLRMDSDQIRQALPEFNVIAILYKDQSVDLHLEAIPPRTYG